MKQLSISKQTFNSHKQNANFSLLGTIYLLLRLIKYDIWTFVFCEMVFYAWLNFNCLYNIYRKRFVKKLMFVIYRINN